jgi:hypothetical protein
MVLTLFFHISKKLNFIHNKLIIIVMMVIERIIYIYNPHSRKKSIEKEKLMGAYESEEEEYKKPEEYGDLIAIKEEDEEIKTSPQKFSLFHLNEKLQSYDLENQNKKKKLWREKIFKTQVFFKYILQISHLILISYFIFVFMPTNGTNNFERKTVRNHGQTLAYYVNPNKFLMIFFLIYSIYLTLSAYQIK